MGRFWGALVCASLVSALLALSASGTRADPAAAAEREIRAALQTWTKAFNAGDTRHVCDLFSHDLIARYRGQPQRNYQSLCALLKKSLREEKKSYRYSLKIQEILVSGDLAVVRLVWTLVIASPAGRRKQMIEEPGIDVFRRQADGRWKISRYLAYAASR